MSVLADKDIDSTMAADWAVILDKHAVEEPEAETVAVEPAEPAQESAADRGDGRRKDGTFAPKAAEPSKSSRADKQEAAPTEGTPAETVAEPVVGAKGQKLDITQAPSTWKPAARAEFAKLPEAVRAEIHRRETDALNGQSQLLPDAQFGKTVRSVVEPYRMLIESEGGTPERAIGDLLRTAAQLRLGTPQQKVEIFARVAQQYGVDLRAFASPGQQPTQQPPPAGDPRVDQLIGQLNQERQFRAQQEQVQLEGTVTQWMNEQDSQGQPLRPYLGDVMNEMNALVPQIRQANPSLNHNQVLQQAYETAIWGNPEIRPLLIQQAQGTAQVRDPANQNRVREARRAASVNVPRRASTPAAGKPGTIEETLTETARALGLIT
jgi:hypothetical protein